MIDITMTAVRRPTIIERTLSSFKKNLFKDHPTRLIINIDPVGEDTRLCEITDVIEDYFPYMITRIPAKPHFTKAFIWTWQQATSKYVFHLEDDWELLRPVDLDAMIALMDKYPDLGGLRLAWKDAEGETVKNFPRSFFDWNGEYFECPIERRGCDGTCGHPTLYRGELIERIVPYMREEYNPEKQLRYWIPEIPPIIEEYTYGVFAQPNDKAIIAEIGERWRNQHGWVKQGGCSQKAFFKWWIKQEEYDEWIEERKRKGEKTYT